MAHKRAVNYPRRGEVYLVNFDPVIAAITSQFEEPLYPTEVLLTAGEGGTTRDSVILLNQIRSVDKRRLARRLGTIRSESMRRVDRSLQISLGLISI
jgi:mRNA interferase MazF